MQYNVISTFMNSIWQEHQTLKAKQDNMKEYSICHLPAYGKMSNKYILVYLESFVRI